MNNLEQLLDLLNRNKCIHSLTPFKQSVETIARDLQDFVAGKIKRVYSDFDGAGHAFVKFNKTEVLDFTLTYLRSYRLVRIDGRQLKLTKHAFACIQSTDFMYSVTYPYIRKQYNNSKNKKDILRTISDLTKLKPSERNSLISCHEKWDNEKTPNAKEKLIASKIKGGQSSNRIWFSTHLYLIPNQSLISIYKSLKSGVPKEINHDKIILQKIESKISPTEDERDQELLIKAYQKKLSREQILDLLINLKKYESKEVISNIKALSRDNKTIALLKIIRNFKCQICGTTIKKKDGSYYIEAAHIKAKKEKGKETPQNIILLCPNHHKEFDFGKRKIISHKLNVFEFELNGKKHKINMTLSV